MQDSSSLVSAESDLRSTSSMLGRAREFASRPLSLAVVSRLGSGALAGLAFGVSDLIRACGAGWVGLSCAAAVVGLWIWFDRNC